MTTLKCGPSWGFESATYKLRDLEQVVSLRFYFLIGQLRRVVED